jgi:hypothetical protein
LSEGPQARVTFVGRSLDGATADRLAMLLAALLALVLFLTTLQLEINGSPDPYATDVGEIQNALPRWGTIHFTGYPQYTLLGSLFVTGLRLVGIAPAAAASLFSAAWGALSVGLLTALIIALGVRRRVAVGASVLFALSTSMWIDASLAELHTMTMALTFASLLAALHFGRHGRKRDLYWLAFLAGQGVTHQRAFAFVAPALLVLAGRQWRSIWSHLPGAIALALIGPLTYLYLPLVDWLGSDWVFSAPGTWEGFWALVLDTKAERIISLPATAADWWRQLSIVIDLLNDDWPWPLWVVGLVALTCPWRRIARYEQLGLGLVWIPYLLVSLIVWEGRVSDALLAVKIPVIAAAAVGLGFLVEELWRWRRPAGLAGPLVGLLVAGYLFFEGRPDVAAITRHDGAKANIALAEQLPPTADGSPITMMALWGSDFWQLAYAQTFQGRFPHLNLVDHNAPFKQIVADGNVLVTLTQTFLFRPIEWWEKKLGPVYLETYAPGVIEIRTEARTGDLDTERFRVNDDLSIASYSVEESEGGYLLRVQWMAETNPGRDYSVAVHLVSVNPPGGPADILAQADSLHPVEGWYPTTRWGEGQVVHDMYRLPMVTEEHPVAIRVTAYYIGEDGQFVNGEWLSIGLE